MSLTFKECWEGSRNGSVGRTSEDVYVAMVYGDPDPATDDADNPLKVCAFFEQHIASLSQFGNVLDNYQREWVAPGFWRFTINFRSPTGDRQTNDASFSFCTGGGSTHITHSRLTVNSYGAPDDQGNPQDAPDCQGGINVTDSSVEGIDIIIPSYDFKTTFYLPPSAMSQSYVRSLYTLTGKVNSDAVTMTIDGVTLTFAAGELLFKGADGSKRKGFTDWELTLNWSGSPNAQNLAIGPITGISKDGWDYLWVKYQPDTDGNQIIQTPVAVYIERVYDRQPLQPLIQSTSFGLTNTLFWQAPTAVSGGGVS